MIFKTDWLYKSSLVVELKFMSQKIKISTVNGWNGALMVESLGQMFDKESSDFRMG